MTDDEKYKAVPIETRVQMFKNIDDLIELHKKQNELMLELKRSLMHKWEKNVDNKVEVTAKSFKALVNAYYTAVEAGAPQFKWQESELLVGYAKYLIEYLEPIVERQEGEYQASQFSSATRYLRERRREHKKRMEEKDG